MRNLILLLPLFAAPAFASADDAAIAALERRLADLERKHQADTQRIADLEARLRAATPPASPTADRAPAANKTPPTSDPLPTPRPDFIPQITLTTDFLATHSRRKSNDFYNRFDVREIELDLRAKVHPRADAVAILAFERHAENPVFPESPAEETGGPDSEVNIEEAYVHLHDLGIPDLTAKLGRFHLRFGRQNLLHPHERLTADAPLVNQAFLVHEALVDSGVSLSYVLPRRLVAGQHIQLTAEIVSGEGAASESASLPGDLTVDSPAYNFHALWSRDLAENLHLEIGASWLHGRRDSSNDLDVDLLGLDFTLTRKDDHGHLAQLLQAEVIYGHLDTAPGQSQHAWGFYALAQQQIVHDWHAGLRIDWTQNPTADDQEAWALTPYLTWHASDNLRFRLMYQHTDGDPQSNDALWFQATWTLGTSPHHTH